MLILVAYGFVHVLFFCLPDLFTNWESRALDRLFRFRNNFETLRPANLDAIVHVDLNQTTIQKLQTYFPDRSYHARVIANLSTMGVSAQLFDYIFAARQSLEEDTVLIQATRDAGNVYFGLAFELNHQGTREKALPKIPEDIRRYLDKTSWAIQHSGKLADLYTGTRPLVTFPELAAEHTGTGFLNLTADTDGTFRRIPLLVRYEDAFYPSIAFRIICDTLKVSPEHVHIKPGKAITLIGANIPGKNRIQDIKIPIDTRGRMIINYTGPWEHMTHYNYVDVLRAADDRDEMEIWQEELAGKIAVISEVATGSTDIGPVPTDPHFPLSGIHANAMHTLLSGAFIRELPPWGRGITEVALMALIFVCAASFASTRFIMASASLVSFYICAWIALFLYAGVIMHLVRPLMIVSGAIILVTAHRYIREERSKALLRATFEAYFPPTVVKKLVANPELIATGGQKKELTVLFSDIVGFTGLTSQMEPAVIQKLLNRYFQEMTDIVFTHAGTVDKFIGDGLLVFFGDPEDQTDHALRCVAAAQDMQRKVSELTSTWETLAGLPIRIRIGINTGHVVVGNMGSPKRLSYTVIGSAVNLAQRLEANAPESGILISRSTFDQVKKKVNAHPDGNIKVKGFCEPIAVYTVSV